MKFEIILPLLCFLLDPLTNRHCRAWSSMINFWRDSRTCQKWRILLSARSRFNCNYLELSKENVLRNMMLSHWLCFTWKFFLIWFHKILKLILKAAIMPQKYMYWTLEKTTYLTWQFSWTFTYTLILRTSLLNMCKRFC